MKYIELTTWCLIIFSRQNTMYTVTHLFCTIYLLHLSLNLMLLTSISFIVGMDKRLWNSQLKACNLKYGIYGNKTKKSNKSCTKYPTHMQHKITQSTIVYTNVTTNISYRALNQIQQFHINHFHVIINTSWLNLKETVLNFVCRAKHWDFCETKLTVSPGTSLQVNCYIAGNSLNLAATAVVVNICGY